MAVVYEMRFVRKHSKILRRPFLETCLVLVKLHNDVEDDILSNYNFPIKGSEIKHSIRYKSSVIQQFWFEVKGLDKNEEKVDQLIVITKKEVKSIIKQLYKYIFNLQIERQFHQDRFHSPSLYRSPLH